MKSIQEKIRDIIEQRVLPWIERDGISKLILPEQITSADCTKPVKCKQSCSVKHREIELIIGLTGKATYCIENKTFVFTPGRIMLLPPWATHAPAQKNQLRAIDIDLRRPSSTLWLKNSASGICTQVIRVMDEKKDTMEASRSYMLLEPHFGRLTKCLLEEVRSRPSGYAGVGRCILMEIMHRCLRAPTVTSVKVPTISQCRSTSLATGESDEARSKQVSDMVQSAQEFIHSNYNMPISVEDIAEVVDVSANYLGRLFKSATGMTPIQYLTNVRMEAAKELLGGSKLKAREVAGLVGIKDPAYFNRVFRRCNGITPLQHRRNSARSGESKALKPAK